MAVYKSFVLIVTWSYDCIQMMIIVIISVQANDYYWIGTVTLNHITVRKLLVLDRNTWYHTNMHQKNIIDK